MNSENTDRFAMPRKLCDYLNRLNETAPSKAIAVAESGLLELVNEEYHQGFGPIVACWETITVSGQVEREKLDKFSLFIGAELTDEELTEIRSKMEKGKLSLVTL